MDAFEQILGEQVGSSNMLDRFVQLSTAHCPEIQLTECELDALRFLQGGEEATCGVCNADSYSGIIPEKCPFQSDLPNNLWQNTALEERTYEERACCQGDEAAPSSTCSAGGEFVTEWDEGATIVVAVVGVIALCCLGGCCFCCIYTRMNKSSNSKSQGHQIHLHTHNAAANVANPVNINAAGTGTIPVVRPVSIIQTPLAQYNPSAPPMYQHH